MIFHSVTVSNTWPRKIDINANLSNYIFICLFAVRVRIQKLSSMGPFYFKKSILLNLVVLFAICIGKACGKKSRVYPTNGESEISEISDRQSSCQS